MDNFFILKVLSNVIDNYERAEVVTARQLEVYKCLIELVKVNISIDSEIPCAVRGNLLSSLSRVQNSLKIRDWSNINA